ncbi:MAG: SRPBCC domain-containing protein [Anaerolineaceae bacterium]
MKFISIGMALLLIAVQAPGTVKDTSLVTPDGQRVLQQSIVVSAGIDKVWKLASTTEGLRKFAARNILFELRPGGRWWASGDATADLAAPTSIHNEVIGFIPGRMVVIQIGFPSAFPEPVRASHSVFAIFLLERIDARKTRVTETMAGFGDGPEWDMTYELFSSGNAEILNALARVIRTGNSIDWDSENSYSHRTPAER